jgi:hypothetical protein
LIKALSIIVITLKREFDAPFGEPIRPSEKAEEPCFSGHFDIPSFVAMITPKAKSVHNCRPTANTMLWSWILPPALPAGRKLAIARRCPDRT